jgi:hypothetical protein
MSTITTPAFDLGGLCRAIEGRDAAGQAAAYAPDAVLTTVDATTGPSAPSVLRGREAIGAMLDEVCARDMTHEVVFSVQSGDRAAIAVACRYADGLRVHCAATLELRDGLIVAQTTTQAWDA